MLLKAFEFIFFNLGLFEHHKCIIEVSGVKVFASINAKLGIDEMFSPFKETKPWNDSEFNPVIGLSFKFKYSKLIAF
jgi:hypothetical protein